jgi:hypothetical protein
MVSSSWLVFDCELLLDGTERLSPAPHLDCYDDRWREARTYAQLTLSLWGVAFPIALAVLLGYFRSKLRTADFSKKFSQLAFGYKRECAWWEVLAMLKTFLVGGCIVLFRHYSSLQSVLPLGILLVFACFTVFVRPFYNPFFSAALVLSDVRP